jgi:hypothetical protein
MFFVTSHRKRHTHPSHIRFLERLLTYPFCFKSFPEGCTIEISCWDSWGHACSYGNLWQYLVMLGVVTTPCDITQPQILMLYNREDTKPLGTFLVVTCCRNCCPNNSSKFLCLLKSLYELNLQIIWQSAAPFITTVHHVSYFYILLSTSNNKSTYSSIRELQLDSWISILKCPARAYTSFPQESTAWSTLACLTSTITHGIQQLTTSQITADGRNDFHFPCSFLTPKRITFLCSKCIKFQHGRTQHNDIAVPSCHACNA